MSKTKCFSQGGPDLRHDCLDKTSGSEVCLNDLLKGLPMTADNKPMILGIKIYMANPDKEYFGDEDIIEDKVMRMDIAPPQKLTGDEGDFTIGGEEWEGGNLECYTAKDKVAF